MPLSSLKAALWFCSSISWDQSAEDCCPVVVCWCWSHPAAFLLQSLSVQEHPAGCSWNRSGQCKAGSTGVVPLKDIFFFPPHFLMISLVNYEAIALFCISVLVTSCQGVQLMHPGLCTCILDCVLRIELELSSRLLAHCRSQGSLLQLRQHKSCWKTFLPNKWHYQNIFFQAAFCLCAGACGHVCKFKHVCFMMWSIFFKTSDSQALWCQSFVLSCWNWQ